MTADQGMRIHNHHRTCWCGVRAHCSPDAGRCLCAPDVGEAPPPRHAAPAPDVTRAPPRSLLAPTAASPLDVDIEVRLTVVADPGKVSRLSSRTYSSVQALVDDFGPHGTQALPTPPRRNLLQVRVIATHGHPALGPWIDLGVLDA